MLRTGERDSNTSFHPCGSLFIASSQFRATSPMPRTLAARTWIATKRMAPTRSFWARLAKKRVRTHKILVVAA